MAVPDATATTTAIAMLGARGLKNDGVGGGKTWDDASDLLASLRITWKAQGATKDYTFEAFPAGVEWEAATLGAHRWLRMS